MKNKSGIWWSNCISSVVIMIAFVAIGYQGWLKSSNIISFLIPFLGLYFVYDNQISKTVKKEDRFIFKNKIKFL